MHNPYSDGTHHQQGQMVGNRSPVVSTFIGKRTGCTEYLYNGYQAEEQVNNPDRFIPFKKVF